MIRLLLTALLLAPQLASAQMFPSPSGRLHFFAAKDAEIAAQVLARTADEDRDWAAREVGRDYDGVTEVRVAIDPVAFVALQPPTGIAPPWASGVAYPALNLVVIRVTAQEKNPRALLRHELSHVAVGRLTKERAPRWLLEGLAVVHSGDAWSEEGPSLMQAALADSLFTFEELTKSFPSGPTDAELAYAQSAAFVKYLINQFGEDKLQDILREMVKGTAFDDAVLKVTSSTPRQLENAWRRSLSKWEMLIRLGTSREFFWGCVALLALLAGGLAYRRRRNRLVAMEHQEKAEAMRALIRTPAVWADQLNADPDPEAANSEDEDGLPDDGDDELPEHLVSAKDTTPKKPTIH